MTNAMAAFGIAVGGTSLICYALMTRLQNRKRKRGVSGDSSSDGGIYNYSSGDGWSLPVWFGGDHSASDSSGNPSTLAAVIAEQAATEVAVATNARGRGQAPGF